MKRTTNETNAVDQVPALPSLYDQVPNAVDQIPNDVWKLIFLFAQENHFNIVVANYNQPRYGLTEEKEFQRVACVSSSWSAIITELVRFRFKEYYLSQIPNWALSSILISKY
jgi:hypothetical protein